MNTKHTHPQIALCDSSLIVRFSLLPFSLTFFATHFQRKMAENVILSQKAITNINGLRKRGFHPDQWKCNVAKSKRNKGDEYQSKRGNLVPAKIFIPQGKVCWIGCHFTGCDLPDAVTNEINAQFWRIGEYGLQRTHLLGLIEVKQHNEKRQVKYTVPVNGEHLEVCQKTFLHIYGITKNIITTIITKKEEGKLVIEDGRGHHANHHRLDQHVTIAITNHLNRYPQYDVHYSRRTQGEQYLSADLNLSVMFRQFKDSHPDIENVDAKEWIFRKTFKDSGLKFGEPKSDTCKECDELFAIMKYSPTENAKLEAEQRLQAHQTRADHAYGSMYADIAQSKLDDSYIVVCCDLQQVLFTPTLTHGEMFYLRQFSSYNFCIYDGGSDSATMNIWHECQGKRGVDEIASAVLRYIRETFEPLQPNQTRTFVVWSDRCRGQNNNYQMLCTLLLMIKERYFTKVTQKFLTTGHSFLPCDRLFAMIERRKKVTKAFVPEDWIDIIQSSQPSKPFQIIRHDQTRIMQIKGYLDVLFPRPSTLKVSEVVVSEIDAASPNVIRTKATHDQVNWNDHIIPAQNQLGVRIANRVPLDLFNINVNLERKYFQDLPLNESKKQDLRAMMQFLSPENRQFYEQYF